MKKVIVIGAGLGGLSAAASLAHAGYDVKVFEKNSSPGGKASSFTKDGFRFDKGPSLMTMIFAIEDLFKNCGEKAEDWLKIKPLSDLCLYHYADGTKFTAYQNPEIFEKELIDKAGETPGALKNFLQYSKTIYDLSGDVFLKNSFQEINDLFNAGNFKTLLKIYKLDAFRTMHKAIKSFFKSPYSIQLFDRYATYNGSSPYKAPATLNSIAHVENSMGAYVFEHGIFDLPKAIEKLAKSKGAEILYNNEVTEIISSGKRLKGVQAKTGFHKADIVISNADAYYTYKNLINFPAKKPKIKDNEMSTSALVFYWGINRETNFKVHNIFFPEYYPQEFDNLFNKNSYPEDPTVYLYISSKYSKEDAPAGCENFFAMINAPSGTDKLSKEEIDTLKEKVTKKISSHAGFNIRDHIISESVLTPADIAEQTNSYKGSLYGLSSNNKYAAFLRQRNRSKKIPGLFFTGGSAHPGGGMPLVILSGMITAKLVKRHYHD